MTSDERVLELLARGLESPAAEPPAARIAEVRERAMAERVQARSLSRPWPRRLVVATAALAAAVVAFGIGLVVADDMPRSLREVAHGIGLPVESPELADARHELQRLGVALGQCDLGSVAAADARMLAIVETLDPDERDKITPVAHEVHLRAVASLKANACA